MTTFSGRFGKKTADLIWNKSDDAILTSRRLSEIYNGVPPDLDCHVRVLELHIFPTEKREEVLKWLNRNE